MNNLPHFCYKHIFITDNVGDNYPSSLSDCILLPLADQSQLCEEDSRRRSKIKFLFISDQTFLY